MMQGNQLLKDYYDGSPDKGYSLYMKLKTLIPDLQHPNFQSILQ